MGLFTVRVGIAHPTDSTKRTEFELWVDTGATLSQIPRELADQLGVPRLGTRSFFLADGRKIDRETAGAMLYINGRQGYVTVIVGEPGDGHLLLGATALETLGFVIDPIGKRLVPQEHIAQY